MQIILLKPFISAPVDIILMLLGAFIIGFVMAWLLRTRRIRDMGEAGYHLQKEVGQLAEANESLEIKNMKMSEELEQCQKNMQGLVPQEELDKALSDLRIEKERSMTVRSSLNEIESAYDALKRELEQKIKQMVSTEEATRLQAEANRLKIFNASLQEEITLLKSREAGAATEEKGMGFQEHTADDITDPHTFESSFEDETAEEINSEDQASTLEPKSEEGSSEEATLAGLSSDDQVSIEPMGEFTEEEPDEGDKGYGFLKEAGISTARRGSIDDLKLINGVGPFIEKKLNQIGIFTFEQIASLSHEQTERITEAIEFFPGRIKRDDWVGQARDLMN